MSPAVDTGQGRERRRCSLCFSLARAASVRLADCRHKDANTPDPAAKWQFALDAQGWHSELRFRCRTRLDARQMGLALGVAAETPRQRGGHRLETHAQKASATETVRREKASRSGSPWFPTAARSSAFRCCRSPDGHTINRRLRKIRKAGGRRKKDCERGSFLIRHITSSAGRLHSASN